MFKVGDLVAESYRPYWYYGMDSFYYGYGYGYDFRDEDYWTKPPHAGGVVVGLVVEVTTREPYPTEYHVALSTVYRVKWLNAPYGDWRDWRYFYEDELKLLSSVGDNKE